ncbi:MAG: KpsF/GutQ family sugar-phosphate isomerase [Bacteroidales bacterium]|nr:KpsF/GutQ family sugar-phosphate isomerase [Bacteroidales bacterium]
MKDFVDIISNAKKTILSEAESISLLVDYIDDSFAKIVNLILQSKGRIVVTGIGKSAHIATKIVATLNSTGTPAVFMHATEAIHGDLGMIQTDDIVLCLSRSGNTAEIKVLVPLLKRGGNVLIAMVSEKDSYLAQHSDYIIHSYVEREACPYNLAPTTSTTAQLVLGDALAMALLQQRKFSPEDFAKFHPGGSLGKRMYLHVSDLMDESKKPQVLPNQSISEVIMEISSKRLGATAVISDTQTLLGVITDGDLRRMLEKTSDVSNLRAADIMTKNPKCIGSDELAIEAFNSMEENNITQMVVAEGETYLGMIHLHDLIKEGIV